MEKKQNESHTRENSINQSKFQQGQSPKEKKEDANPNSPTANKNDTESKGENEVKNSNFFSNKL